MSKTKDSVPAHQFQRLEDQLDYTLLQRRHIMINSGFDEHLVGDIIRKLWYLNEQDNKAPIYLFIHSPGGSIDAGFAIWDHIQLIEAPVYTIVTGLAASMGSLISLCAPKGKRFATPNSRIMIHQPAIGGVIRGQATDLEIQAKEIMKTRKRIVSIYAEATGQDAEVIDQAIDRDNWMSADEALEFGLVDHIIRSLDEIK